MEERLLHGFCLGQRRVSGTRRDFSDKAQVVNSIFGVGAGLRVWRGGAFIINRATRKLQIKCSRRHLYTKV